MKKGYVIYLVLISVGAVVFGATFVLLDEFPKLVEQWNENERQTVLVEPAAEKNEPPELFAPSVQTTAPIVISNLISNSGSQVLTENEQEQVQMMLRKLGVAGENFTETVKAYQTKKSLEATGVLTTETLEEIVRDLTITKVATL